MNARYLTFAIVAFALTIGCTDNGAKESTGTMAETAWSVPDSFELKDGMGQSVMIRAIAEITEEEDFTMLEAHARAMNPCNNEGTWKPQSVTVMPSTGGGWKVYVDGMCANAYNVYGQVHYYKLLDSSFKVIPDSTLVW
jgi:hypothetical protein